MYMCLSDLWWLKGVRTHSQQRPIDRRALHSRIVQYLYVQSMYDSVCVVRVVSIIRLWAVEVSWKLKVQCEWRTGYAAVGCRMAAHLLRRWSSLRAQI